MAQDPVFTHVLKKWGADDTTKTLDLSGRHMNTLFGSAVKASKSRQVNAHIRFKFYITTI